MSVYFYVSYDTMLFLWPLKAKEAALCLQYDVIIGWKIPAGKQRHAYNARLRFPEVPQMLLDGTQATLLSI